MKHRSHGWRREISAISTIISVLLLVGCASVGKPDSRETAAIRKNEKSLVLIRAVRTEDAGDETVGDCDIVTGLWRLDQADGRIEFGPSSESVKWKAADKVSGQQGWRYALVAPGNYFVEVHPHVSGKSAYLSLPTGNEDRKYYLSIPGGKQFVYAGTFVFNQTSSADSKSVGLEPLGSRNETEMATQVAAERLPEFGKLTPCVALPYGDLREALATFQKGRSVSMGFAPGASPDMNGHHLGPAIVVSSPFWVPGAFLVAVAGETPGGGSGEGALYLGAAGLALMVVAVPVVAVVGGVTATVHHFKWAPYKETFEKEVGQFDLQQQLAESMKSRLATDSGEVDSALVLQLQPYRIALLGGESQEFHLEVAVRARLIDPQTHAVIWQNSYVHSHQNATNIALAPYEMKVSSRSTSHRLAEFKSDHGAGWFRTDLQNSMEDLSEAIAKDVKEGSVRTE